MATSPRLNLEHASIIWCRGVPPVQIATLLGVKAYLLVDRDDRFAEIMAHLRSGHPASFDKLFPLRNPAMWDDPDYRSMWLTLHGTKFDPQTGKRIPELWRDDAVAELYARLAIPRGRGAYRIARHHLMHWCRAEPLGMTVATPSSAAQAPAAP